MPYAARRIAIARSVEGWQDDGREASFRRWLNRVARNAVIKFMGRERRQTAAEGGTDVLLRLEQLPDRDVVDATDNYEHELFVWAVRQVRAEFRENSWRAIWSCVNC